jgi:hypothetical protein
VQAFVTPSGALHAAVLSNGDIAVLDIRGALYQFREVPGTRPPHGYDVLVVTTSTSTTTHTTTSTSTTLQSDPTPAPCLEETSSVSCGIELVRAAGRAAGASPRCAPRVEARLRKLDLAYRRLEGTQKAPCERPKTMRRMRRIVGRLERRTRRLQQRGCSVAAADGALAVGIRLLDSAVGAEVDRCK